MAIEIGGEVKVVIEVPRGSLVKWAADGSVDFLSPVPCPFNYGSIVGSRGLDGDPEDAVVIGPVVGRGVVASWPIRGRVDFVDAGIDDPKWICAAEPLTESQWRRISWFFEIYGVAKGVINGVRRKRGPTKVVRMERE